MIKMKALRSFGVSGSNEGHISRGREFTAAHEARARDLEEHGLAYRLETKMEPRLLNKMEDEAPSNKSADEGPFDSVGGMTGEDEDVPSLPQDQQQPRRRGRPPGSRNKAREDSEF